MVAGLVPTWPTMVKPVGSSSCSSSGRMAVIMSSGGSYEAVEYIITASKRTHDNSSSHRSTPDRG